MSGHGGDEVPGGPALAGGEPEPAEVWVSDGVGDAGTGGPAFGLDPPPPGSGRDRLPGPGRARWIALALGFVVLVAVIALQHVISGHAGASPTTGPPTTGPSTAAGSPSPAPGTASRSGTAGSGAAGSSAAGSSASGSSAAGNGASHHSQAPGATPGSRARGSAGSPVTPRRSAPVTVTVSAHARPLPDPRGWDLIGYGAQGLVRYRPATGLLVTTPVPPLEQGRPLSLVVTRVGAIVRPLFSATDGYSVAPGRPAAPLTGPIGSANQVLPGPDSDHLWLASTDGETTSLTLVRGDGSAAGTAITLPAVLSTGAFSITSDGAGYTLVTGVGGTYDARPDGLRLVTHGRVLAAGPTAFLVEQCDTDARCSVAVIDRSSGATRTLERVAPSADYQTQGTISPDGRYAALVRTPYTGPQVVVIDLRTGAMRTPAVDVDAVGVANDTSTVLAFTPDSRELLVVTADQTVTPVDAATGDVRRPLPLPPLSAIAILPTP